MRLWLDLLVLPTVAMDIERKSKLEPCTTSRGRTVSVQMMHSVYNEFEMRLYDTNDMFIIF
jgi:hypothetical protein